MSANVFIFIGFLSGSIPFGLILTRLFAKKDVRSEGSGNIGATNVARVAGKKVGALVLVLDALKGLIPVALAMHWWPTEPMVHVDVAFAAFLGHVFPPWLRFKGGKGVATALGVLLVLLPQAALAGFVVWLLVIATVRVSSVGSLLGALVAIVVAFFLDRPLEYALLAVVLLIAMLITHRGNLQRLWQRKENKV